MTVERNEVSSRWRQQQALIYNVINPGVTQVHIHEFWTCTGSYLSWTAHSFSINGRATSAERRHLHVYWRRCVVRLVGVVAAFRLSPQLRLVFVLATFCWRHILHKTIALWTDQGAGTAATEESGRSKKKHVNNAWTYFFSDKLCHAKLRCAVFTCKPYFFLICFISSLRNFSFCFLVRIGGSVPKQQQSQSDNMSV